MSETIARTRRVDAGTGRDAAPGVTTSLKPRKGPVGHRATRSEVSGIPYSHEMAIQPVVGGVAEIPHTARGGLDEELAWHAVLSRDPRFGNAFFYAVRTTGVYCRVTCAARRPRRENVRFYRTPQEAVQAGFRACKRCRPDGTDPVGEVITRACLYLEEHVEDTVTLKRLGRAVGMSSTHLQRAFKQRTGVSPKEYADSLRLSRLKTHLREGGGVTRAIYEAGYATPSTAYAAADAHLGMTPATYQAGGRGAVITFAVVDCALGKLLVARTERGICAVALGDSEAALQQSLREEFPLAEIEADPQQLADVCCRVAELAAGADTAADLPLDVRATGFQWRAWRALREIPLGQTRSYSEVAAMIGAPRAARAVARACAGNPVALVIPCHRVVRADGTPGGYRWETFRKDALLAHEADRTDSQSRLAEAS